MSGTQLGAAKAVATLKERDPDFYKRIGSIGGKNGSAGKGFAANRELAREAGRLGGQRSKRGVSKK